VNHVRPCLLTLSFFSFFFFFFQIRIQGYRAVVQVSKEQPVSVERNVDVLVQLLQSGESSYDGEESRSNPSAVPFPLFLYPPFC
jgi:hypothetical protein